MKGSWETEARPQGDEGELEDGSAAVSLRQVGDAEPSAANII
jgi:hypothetical protein